MIYLLNNAKILNIKLTLLVKTLNSSISKRYYPTNSSLSQMALKKLITPQVLLEQQNLIRNKTIFLRFCQHFKGKPFEELLKDSYFMQLMHDSIHKEPTLYSRAFQLALEVTYSKRRFSEKVLQEMYKQDFLVQDTFNVNNGICEQSTVYTSILAKKVTNYFNTDVNDVIVNSTPIFLTKEKITSDTQKLMDYNKKMTDNTCPDITLKGRPYDFKEVKDTSFGKNQIYFIDTEEIAKKGLTIFYKLEKHLTTYANNVQKNISYDVQAFSSEILNSLRKASEEQAPIQHRIDILNNFLVRKDIPRDFQLPIFIPIKKANVELLEITNAENVVLDKGHLDFVKAKKAIMGILDTYDSKLKSNIQDITHNSIQFNIPKVEELD